MEGGVEISKYIVRWSTAPPFFTMKVRDVIKRLQDDGWYLDRTKGSHRQFKHPAKPGLVTVSGKMNIDLPKGTLKSIWRQSQIQEDI